MAEAYMEGIPPLSSNPSKALECYIKALDVGVDFLRFLIYLGMFTLVYVLV